MSYLSRKKVYEKVEPQKDAKKIYVICEGQDREVSYFRYFRGIVSNIDIIPIPNNNGESDPLKLKELAGALFLATETIKPKHALSWEYGDEVWFVIDTDRWNEGNKIGQLLNFCENNNQEYGAWFVGQSNPSFELWLYYHFHDEKPSPVEIEAHPSFKDYIGSKITGGFDSRKMPIELETAINNSSANYEEENRQPKVYSTNLHVLGQIIFDFTKNELEKARKMMASATNNQSQP